MRGRKQTLLCFMLSQAKKVGNHCLKSWFVFHCNSCCMRVHVYYWLSYIRWLLSSLIVLQSGLLWLILRATVAKHSARPTTTDVLTVFNGARPIHCGLKVPLCFVLKVAERPQTVFLKSHVSFISNDITSKLCTTTEVAVVTPWWFPWFKMQRLSRLMEVMCIALREWRSIQTVSIS